MGWWGGGDYERFKVPDYPGERVLCMQRIHLAPLYMAGTLSAQESWRGLLDGNNDKPC